jgi:DNA-binding response OmpR family regulator
VLVVEDEELLADAVARGLRREGMAVDVVGDGEAALGKLDVNAYDVVVLDRDLPVVHGDDVCRAIVVRAKPPRVLMLTAAAGTDDLVDGLAIGADDYMGKPFAFPELVARVHTLARRTGAARPPMLRRGDLVLDPAARTVTRAGRQVILARKEFAVLEALMEADGAVISAEQILEHVWDENTDPFTNVVRVTVMNLRKKLGEPAVIETVIGSGYRL